MSEPLPDEVEGIGRVAGDVWHYLRENGPVTLTQLARAIDSPRDSVMQALGWLAREGKVAYYGGSRTKRVGLSTHD